jgi:hypothetical protein
MELEIQIAERLGFLSREASGSLLASTDEISRMLSGLRSSLNSQSSILDPQQCPAAPRLSRP